MKRYRVEFSAEAKAEIERSFEWGVREWGIVAAHDWYKLLTRATRLRLAMFPSGCPLAPENDDFPFEVRHMIIGRYRLIFKIEKRTVRILHLRGSYIGSSTGSGDDE